MNKEVVELYLDDIIPNRFQPREVFNEEALQELSASIKEHGVIQPIIVRKLGDKYEIIAGERRYKATALAGLTKIPAIIRNLDDKEASKVALLENLQRKDLSAIEEARTYQKILELDTMTQEELGRSMGKSQAAIANKMRLLSLPDEIQEALLHDKISERHARSLLNLDSSEEQIKMLNKIIDKRMTVRELDNEIQNLKGNTKPSEEEKSLEAIVSEVGPIIEVDDKENNIKIEPPVDDLDEEDNIIKIDEDSNEEIKEEPSMQSPLERINFLLNQTKVFTLKDAVSSIKGTVEKLKTKGFEIRLDEMDFENSYQVVIKINKNK